MPRSNETLMRVAAICLPMLLLAAGARYALKPAKNGPMVSTAVPSAEELDSLAKYLSARPARGVPLIASVARTQIDQPDPFISMEIVPTDGTGAAASDTPAVRPMPRERYVVSAILIASDNRLAVVNESVVTVGTMLPGGFRVTAIENDHIEIVAPSGVRRMLTVRESTGP
jgi:hypothetical protein